MKRTLSFSPRAEREIQSISNYTLERFGEDQVRRYINGLFTEIDRRAQDPHYLTENEPELARCIRAPEGTVQSFLYNKHRCYFTFDNERLRILTVLHGATGQRTGIY